MTDAGIISIIIKFGGYLLAALIGSWAWVTKLFIIRQIKRINAIEGRERHYVTHDAVDKQLLAISAEMRTGFERMDNQFTQVHHDIQGVHDRIDNHLDRRKDDRQ